MGRLRTGPLSFIAAGAAALVAAAPAGAIEFGRAVTVSAPGFEPRSPAAALNASGDLAVGWTGLFTDAFFSYHPRHGSFGRVQRLRGYSLAGLEITTSGETIAALVRGHDDASLGGPAYVAVRPAGRGKKFGRPVDLSQGQSVSGLALDANSHGEAVAVWEAGSRVWAAIRSADGSWSAPVALSDARPGEAFTFPRVAVLPSGAALAVWHRVGGVQGAVRPAGGSFGAPVTLAPAGAIRDLKGAGSRWGVLVQDEEDLQLIERPEVGSFAPPVSIPGSTAEYGSDALALAPDGAATVLKSVPLPKSAECSGQTYDDAHALATSSRPAGGAFGADHLVTLVGQPGASPSAAVAGGRELFVWDQPQQTALGGDGAYDDELDCGFLGSRPYGADGTPGTDPGQSAPAVDQATANGFPLYPGLGTDAAGNAAVAWVHTDERGRNQRVRVALIGGGSLGRNPYPDIVSPRVLNLRLSSRRVHPGEPMTLRFRLSERARVVMTITRWWGKFIPGQFHTQRVRTIRLTHRRGPVTLRFPAPTLRSRHYSVHLEVRDRGGNPSFGGPFNLKLRVR